MKMKFFLFEKFIENLLIKELQKLQKFRKIQKFNLNVFHLLEVESSRDKRRICLTVLSFCV